MFYLLESLPPMVLREILFRWINECTSLKLDFPQLNEIVALTSKELRNGNIASVTLDQDWELMKIGSELRLKRRIANTCDLVATNCIQSPSISYCILHPRSAEILPYNASAVVPQSDIFSVEIPMERSSVCENNFTIVLRFPILNDKIKQLVNGNLRSILLSKYLQNMKVPIHQRDRVLVLTTQNAENNEVLEVFLPASNNSISPKCFSNYLGPNSCILCFNIKYQLL